MNARLNKQIEFLVEIDKLKSVFRQTYLLNESRKENDAEHSWHLAMAAVVLAEHAAEPGIDLAKVIRMVLVHDLVEIDAGDTFAYDRQANRDKAQRERAAAERIFPILPADQAETFAALWDEFELRQTPEAKFAAALDRLQPLLHNCFTGGRAWREHGVTAEQVLERNRHVAEGSETLWRYVEALIQDAVARGYLPRAGTGDDD